MINYLEEKIGLILWYLAFVLLQLVMMFLLDMNTSFLIFFFVFISNVNRGLSYRQLLLQK